MSTIYIVSDYGKLIKKGETLQLKRENDLLKTIFPFKTEHLIIMGNIEVTASALRMLMHHNIDTVFLSGSGKFNGKLAFQTGKNVFLRQKQFKLLENNEFKLNFAKTIAAAKMKNQLSFMQRIGRKRDTEGRIDIATEKLKGTIRTLETAENLDSARGYEGLGARHYFSIFRYSIIQDWAVFNGRSMHPPEDNVNAVLSFLYTMIFFRVDAALETEGLDSYAGLFHTLDYGKRTLSFDLMEEYRVVLGDMLAVSLFNLNILKPEDFEEVVFSEKSDDFPLQIQETSEGESELAEPVVYQEKRGVLLTKEGLRKVITQFEKKLDTPYFYAPLAKQITYKQLIHEQISHFKRVIMGEEREYKPLVIK